MKWPACKCLANYVESNWLKVKVKPASMLIRLAKHSLKTYTRQGLSKLKHKLLKPALDFFKVWSELQKTDVFQFEENKWEIILSY